MSKRAALLVALLTVVTMAGGVTGGVLLGRVDAGRRDARAVAAPPSTVALATSAGSATSTAATTQLPGTTAATGTIAPTTSVASPTTAAASATTAAPPTTTGPPSLSARVARRLTDGLVVRLDASQPLTEAVLRFGTGGRLDQALPISGTVRHGTVKLPLASDEPVRVQVNGRTARGVLVRSNVVAGQRLPS
jgi:hypothetical protein